MKRPVLLVGLLAAWGVGAAAPALAAAPANDRYADRLVIPGVPFEDRIDTTEATTDRRDAEVNETCGAPATDASVWYQLVAPAGGPIVVDVSRSNYSAGVAVVQGKPGAFDLLTCGPGSVMFEVSEGGRYKILVFDDQLDEDGHGGRLRMSLDWAPPPPEVDVTIDPVGSFDSATGAATIRGTVTCSGGEGDEYLEVSLRQSVGRMIVRGWGWSESLGCDGSEHAWSVDVLADNGEFRGGRTASAASAYTCGPLACSSDYESVEVRLRGR